MAQRCYRIGTAEFGLRTTSREFCGWLDEVLSSYRKRKKAEPYYSIVVDGGEDAQDRRKGFHILYRGTTAIVRTLHLPTLARALLTELESLTFHKREDAIYIQAALMAADGVTAIAPYGLVSLFGGIGRRVQRAGVRLPGTTYLAVSPESGTITPVRKTLDIPDDALARVDGIPPQDGQSDRIFVDDPLTPDMALTFAPIDSSIEPVSRALVLGRLTTGAVNLKRMGPIALEGLARLVERVQCYGLPSGEPRVMLDHMSEALRIPRAAGPPLSS